MVLTKSLTRLPKNRTVSSLLAVLPKSFPKSPDANPAVELVAVKLSDSPGSFIPEEDGSGCEEDGSRAVKRVSESSSQEDVVGGGKTSQSAASCGQTWRIWATSSCEKLARNCWSIDLLSSSSYIESTLLANVPNNLPIAPRPR